MSMKTILPIQCIHFENLSLYPRVHFCILLKAIRERMYLIGVGIWEMEACVLFMFLYHIFINEEKSLNA